MSSSCWYKRYYSRHLSVRYLPFILRNGKPYLQENWKRKRMIKITFFRVRCPKKLLGIAIAMVISIRSSKIFRYQFQCMAVCVIQVGSWIAMMMCSIKKASVFPLVALLMQKQLLLIFEYVLHTYLYRLRSWKFESEGRENYERYHVCVGA